MEGKLIKTESTYHLVVNNKIIGSMGDSDGKLQKLSLKNCQAIERGYDLDELAESLATMNVTRSTQNWEVLKWGIKIGFQKTLEILGDKKFSEEDMRKAYQKGEEDSYTQGGLTKQKEDNYIQSIQQTEWNVEIEMECGEVKQCECSSNNNCLNPQPKLDADGCLILKRK